MALCSESTGRTLMPARRASPMKSSPAQTRHSLLASAMREPARMAASVGASPAAPTIPATTMSTGRAAASSIAAAPAAASMPVPASASLSAFIGRAVGDHRELAPWQSRATRARLLGIAEGGDRLDLEVLRPLGDHGERARPDRAGRAEDGDRAAGDRRAARRRSAVAGSSAATFTIGAVLRQCGRRRHASSR